MNGIIGQLDSATGIIILITVSHRFSRRTIRRLCIRRASIAFVALRQFSKIRGLMRHRLLRFSVRPTITAPPLALKGCRFPDFLLGTNMHAVIDFV